MFQFTKYKYPLSLQSTQRVIFNIEVKKFAYILASRGKSMVNKNVSKKLN